MSAEEEVERERRFSGGGGEGEGGEIGHDGAVIRASQMRPYLRPGEVRGQVTTAEDVVNPRAVVRLPAGQGSEVR